MAHTWRTRRSRIVARALLALASAGSLAAGLGAQQRFPVTLSSSTAMGAVSGVITDAAALRPLSDVNIQLGPSPSPGAARLGSTFTDDRGRFVFTNVAAGTYYLKAIKAGYADGHYGPSLNGSLGANIVLAAGEWFDSANVAMVKLAAIGGHIVDEHGEPVVGAFVRVLTSLSVGGVPHLVTGPAAVTDDLGEYRIAGLRPGRYLVSVPSVAASVPASATVAEIEGLSADRLATRDAQTARFGGSPARRSGGELVEGGTALIVGTYPTPTLPVVQGHAQTYPMTFYPGTTTVTGATLVDVTTTADQSGIDVTLSPVSAVSVSGRLDGASAPYSGVVLRLVPAGLEDLGEGSEAATTAVQSDGTFTFLRVPAGRYLLTGASTSGFAWVAIASGQHSTPLPHTPGVEGAGIAGGILATDGLVFSERRAPGPNESRVGFERLPLEVGDADIRGLVVPVQAPSSIHGEITVEDFPGPTLAGAFELSPLNGEPTLATVPAPILKGPPPTFDFPLVIPGDYELRFMDPFLGIKSIIADGEDSTRRPITVPPGATTKVVVTLTGKAIKVSGTVRDGKGAAVPRAGVIAFPVDQALWTHSPFGPAWTFLSGSSSDGHYQILGLRAGDYYLVGVDAAHFDAWTDPAFLASAVPFATHVSLDWGVTRTVDIPFMVKR
jgi:hypothetical protein